MPDSLAHDVGGLPAARGGAVSIVIVSAHPAVRKGLELLLCSHGHRVVGATNSPDRALQLVVAHGADLVLVDIDDEVAGESALARRMFSERPGLGVLFYTARRHPEMLVEALARGASGLALKSGPSEELLDAITTVARGDTWLDPRLVRPPAPADPGTLLSSREREVLGLLADGLTGEAIAKQLFLSRQTVRTHVRNAMRKLGARTRAQAIAMIARGAP